MTAARAGCAIAADGRGPCRPTSPTGRWAIASFDDAFGPVDDGIDSRVAGGGRTLAVTFLEGYRYAQVYSPPGGQLICFEPMTAPTNAIKTGMGLELLEPGASHRASFRISVT